MDLPGTKHDHMIHFVVFVGIQPFNPFEGRDYDFLVLTVILFNDVLIFVVFL